MEVRHSELQTVEDLYDRGVFIQAYHAARAYGPLQRWTGTEARILAGRLANQLGAPRLGRVLHYLAWRQDPSNPRAIYYHALSVPERYGLLAAWEMQERYGDLPQAPPAIRADFCALRARTFGWLRDFDEAEAWLARAEGLSPDRPWIWVERAALLQMEDRYEESVAAARRALELRMWYPPAVRATAVGLELVGRDSEALDLLTLAAQRLESAAVVAQLAVLQEEFGLHDESRKNLDRVAELAPLMEKGFAEWLGGRRSTAAYLCGALAQAAEFAAQCRSAFFKRIGERLANPDQNGRRLQLPVGFVRQHHLTCVPATLTAISRFWNMPAEHLEVAEQICYDGTSQHSERWWAERNGWATREFSVSWNDATALLDRGVPFTLTIPYAGGGHLVAVVGYDSQRGTLLLRDPYSRFVGEALVAREEAPADDEGRNDHPRLAGLRGMALVPREQAVRLESLTLTDGPAYDYRFRIQTALAEHDRARGQRLYEAMTREFPEHRLTREARLALANYDGDDTARLRCIEQLLNLCGPEPNLLLTKVACLQTLGRRDERLAVLESICASRDSDPLFWQQYAQELARDARQHSRAVALLRRAIRYRPHPGGLFILADILSRQKDGDRALALYGFATCLDDKDEQFAGAYFVAARHAEQTEKVLDFLQSRFARFGQRSGWPARTLFWAYDQLHRTTEAFAVLERALGLRPEDEELLLFAANAYGRYGHIERTSALLEQARNKCKRSTWLRVAAGLARYQGHLKDALVMWQEVLVTEPLAMDAHAAVTALLAATAGRPAALAHLEQTAQRFPHSCPVHCLWVAWLRDDGSESVERVIRHLIEIDPVDVWAHRELALVLAQRRRWDEARAEADLAVQLSPSDSYSFGVLGMVAIATGHRAEAKQAFERAIHLSVDNEAAIVHLFRSCQAAEERRAALAYVQQQLLDQVIFGESLLAYRAYARYALQPEELLATLRKIRETRPDLWQAWAAVVRQLVDMGQLDEADRMGREALERFPLVPQLWQDLAAAAHARADSAAEMAALERALQIDPGLTQAVRALANAYGCSAAPEKARALLEQAVARDPLVADYHVCLAELLWKQGEREVAIARLEHALRLEPKHEWAWGTLVSWSAELKQPEVAPRLARELTVQRAGDAHCWLALAKLLTGAAHLEERLAALQRTIAVDPSCTEAHDLLAELLAEAGRFEEAEAACRPAALANQRPVALRGREAWVLAKQGYLEQAVLLVQAAVKDAPDYSWGWGNLVRWLEALGRDREICECRLEAADGVAPVDVDLAMAYGYRGDAKRQCGNRSGAKADFRRALELAPRYEFAAGSLVALLLDDNELDDVEQTLAQLRSQYPEPYRLAWEVQLAAERGRADAAVERLHALCMSSTQDARPLPAAVEAMLRAGWKSRVRTVFEAVMCETQASPAVGAEWVKHFGMHLKAARLWTRLDQLRRQGAIGWSATTDYVCELARLRRAWTLRRFIRKYRAELQRNDNAWGDVLYALVVLQDSRRAADWAREWTQHGGAQPWSLHNASLSLRRCGDDREANRVCRHALTLPADDCTYYHALYLAVDEALAGRTASAAEHLARVHDVSKEAYFQTLHALVSAVLAVQQSPTPRDAAGFGHARARLHVAHRQIRRFRGVPELWRYYRRCIRRIAADQGGARAKLWALAKLAGL